MKILLCQINTKVGDFSLNKSKILGGLEAAKKTGADIAVFPELSICGYPPRDLLEKPSFIRQNLKALDEIARHADGIMAVVGFVSKNESGHGRPLHNSIAILRDKKIFCVQHKTLLPQYDVFDEARHFEPADDHHIVEFDGKKIGFTACEDMWSIFDFEGRKLYHHDPSKVLVHKGAEMIISVSASPYSIEKQKTRIELISNTAKKYAVPIFYCNSVGGNDELVFDGRSFAVDKNGDLCAQALAFEEDMLLIDTENLEKKDVQEISVEEEIKKALCLGLRDYMDKCGFKKAVIGISGGIDSALVAAIAAETVGPENITGVMMPSRFTSEQSNVDAKKLIANLNINSMTVPIDEIYKVYRTSLGIEDLKEVSLVEENLQARIRGNILMALSNKENTLVLSTGNKSEISVGYCTLYGDMVGGFAVISDLLKTRVYDLSKYFNRSSELIPASIIKRAPSAELKPDQKDEDSLPPYDVLDAIIRAYIEKRLDIDEIVKKGFDRQQAQEVIRLIDNNEYKRRQAAPGIKISSKAFGSGRRLPIACKY